MPSDPSLVLNRNLDQMNERSKKFQKRIAGRRLSSGELSVSRIRTPEVSSPFVAG